MSTALFASGARSRIALALWLSGEQGRRRPQQAQPRHRFEPVKETRRERIASVAAGPHAEVAASSLGAQDTLIRIPSSQILYYNILSGDTLAGWSTDTIAGAQRPVN